MTSKPTNPHLELARAIRAKYPEVGAKLRALLAAKLEERGKLEGIPEGKKSRDSSR